MSFITRNLNQTITYWSPGSLDAFGAYSYNAPITINGRYEERTDLFIDQDGNEIRSQARVYVDQDVELEGYVYLGTSTSSDPTSVSGAREIRDFKKTPTLSANEFERRILL